MEICKLEVGESHGTPEIDARERFGRSGLRVEKGESYELKVRITEALKDKTILVKDTEGFASDSQNGFTKVILRLAQPLRRSPKQNWFYLMGTVGRSKSGHFPIGSGALSEMPASGELFVFLNDVPLMYYNNHGKLRLTIKRAS